MREKFTIYTTFQSDPIIKEVESFMFSERGDLELYDKGKFWFFPYSVLKFVYSEVIR